MKNLKEIGFYESTEGNVRVLLDEDNKMLCDVTTEELAKIVGFKNKESLKRMMERNPRITTEKFSRIERMNTLGGIQETRLFTERGIIEVAFLAGTAKAEKFRDDIYDLLVSLREKNMVSFGANGLDVKRIEEFEENYKQLAIKENQVKEYMKEQEKAEEKLEIVIEFMENIESKIEKMENDMKVMKKELEKINNVKMQSE